MFIMKAIASLKANIAFLNRLAAGLPECYKYALT